MKHVCPRKVVTVAQQGWISLCSSRHSKHRKQLFLAQTHHTHKHTLRVHTFVIHVLNKYCNINSYFQLPIIELLVNRAPSPFIQQVGASECRNMQLSLCVVSSYSFIQLNNNHNNQR
jgi:hypothetical protein